MNSKVPFDFRGSVGSVLRHRGPQVLGSAMLLCALQLLVAHAQQGPGAPAGTGDSRTAGAAF